MYTLQKSRVIMDVYTSKTRVIMDVYTSKTLVIMDVYTSEDTCNNGYIHFRSQ